MRKLGKILGLLVVLFSSFNGYSQSPDIYCLSVQSNGDIQVTYEPSTSLTPVFEYYSIYYDNGAGYTLAGNVNNVNVDNYTITGAGGNLNSVNVYVTVSINSGGSTSEIPAADTLSSIFLSVANPTDGTAILQWNDFNDVISADYGTHYYLYRQLNGNGYFLYDSIPYAQTTYLRDTVSICSANIDYQIRVNHISGCSTTSNTDGDLFEDLIPPDPPVINYVSVDTATGNATISWNPTMAQDASAYIIVHRLAGSWVPIDTIYGYNNTSYTYNNSFADLISEGYGIAAFDSCWSGIPPGPNTSSVGARHFSMYLSNSYDLCGVQINLEWNKYDYWDTPTSHYDIYRNVEGGSYTLLNSVTNLDSLYTDQAIEKAKNYCYYVEAISGDLADTSRSSITCRYAETPTLPSYSYLSNVSVSNEVIEVDYYGDPNGVVTEVNLYRSEDGGVNYNWIDAQSSYSSQMSFTDFDVDNGNQVYYYQMELVDSCGAVGVVTNFGNNILLSVFANNENLTNFLQWTPYQDWSGEILYYEVWRSVNGVEESSPIAQLDANTFFYFDDVSDLIGTGADGEFCYYIKAIEQTNNYGFSEQSLSNSVCVFQNPLVFIPNAIVPSGFNREWSPVLNFVDYTSYLVEVYDRSGTVIYSSSSYPSSWDGTDKGIVVPSGVYLYYLSVEVGSNAKREFEGTITVVR